MPKENKMKPRINKQVRKQLKEERKLETMVKYETQSSDEIRSAIQIYRRKYCPNQPNFFIVSLTKDYETNLRRAGE